MRRAARVDSNQAAIVAAFRDLGCSVFPLHQVGRGFPDLVVGCNGLNLLIEVKDGSKFPSERRLTADEQRFIEAWSGQIYIVSSSRAFSRALNTHSRDPPNQPVFGPSLIALFLAVSITDGYSGFQVYVVQ